MRMPGKSSGVIFRVVVPKVVQQQKRIEILRFGESKIALQLHPSALDRGLGLKDLLNRT
jgi:hypothetical protein